MKKFGIILLALLVWTSVNAEPKAVKVIKGKADTTVIDTDTLKSSVNKTDEFIENVVDKAINAKIDNLEDNDGKNSTKFVGTVLFLVIALPILIVFMAIVLIVYFSSKSRKEREQIRHDVYLKALAAGQPLPEKFFEEPQQKQSSNLKRGAIWLGVGLAITIGFLASDNRDALFLGLLPAFIGAAYLLVYFIEDKKNQTKKGNE